MFRNKFMRTQAVKTLKTRCGTNGRPRPYRVRGIRKIDVRRNTVFQEQSTRSNFETRAILALISPAIARNVEVARTLGQPRARRANGDQRFFFGRP